VKNYRITVETYDGLRTIWYEKSKAKKASSIICNRVGQQLCGLNVRRIEVDLVPGVVTVRKVAHTPLQNA